MKTTDPRDMNWKEICEHLDGARQRIYGWLLTHGPATTMQITDGTKIPLLTVRPRVSELAALGWVECIGRDGRKGSYIARSFAETKRFHTSRQRKETQTTFDL